jgi:ABC-type phosphate transport system substrate-binding protein
MIKTWSVLSATVTATVLLLFGCGFGDASGGDSGQRSDLDLSGSITWEYSSNGIAGVWNPITKSAEWQHSSNYVAGVWNAQNASIEWQYSTNKVAGIWNPNRKTAIHREIHY